MPALHIFRHHEEESVKLFMDKPLLKPCKIVPEVVGWASDQSVQVHANVTGNRFELLAASSQIFGYSAYSPLTWTVRICSAFQAYGNDADPDGEPDIPLGQSYAAPPENGHYFSLIYKEAIREKAASESRVVCHEVGHILLHYYPAEEDDTGGVMSRGTTSTTFTSSHINHIRRRIFPPGRGYRPQ